MYLKSNIHSYKYQDLIQTFFTRSDI